MINLIVQTVGVKQTLKIMNNLQKLPQKSVTKVASAGTTVVRRTIRGEVPVGATGNLRRSIIRNGERSRTKGKKVFDVYFDRAMNDVLQRPIKNPGEFGGKSPYAYYPASMEFGFLTRSKGGGLSYVPGYHFMRGGAEDGSAAAKKAMIDVLSAEIDKAVG